MAHARTDDAPTSPPAKPRGFAAELRDAVTPRAFWLVIGVLLLQLGFILSYLGAFHHPTPHRVPIAVTAPTQAATAQAVGQLNALPGSPLDARAVADEATARSQIRNRTVDGALVLPPSGPYRLLVASAEGGAVSQALEQVVGAVAANQHRALRVTDVVPAGTGDARGLSPFYVAVGWVVGGYLVASILAISAGALPTTQRRALIRLGSLALYAIASGIGGAIIAGPALGALHGHFLPIAGLGALLVFAVGAFTMGIQAWTGIVGIGIAVLLFVVLGNPSAGGAYPAPLLPPFWRAIGPWIPPGAGTSGLRGIVYFDGAGTLGPLLVSAGYAVVGILALTIATLVRRRPPAMTADGDASA